MAIEGMRKPSNCGSNSLPVVHTAGVAYKKRRDSGGFPKSLRWKVVRGAEGRWLWLGRLSRDLNAFDLGQVKHHGFLLILAGTKLLFGHQEAACFQPRPSQQGHDDEDSNPVFAFAIHLTGLFELCRLTCKQYRPTEPSSLVCRNRLPICNLVAVPVGSMTRIHDFKQDRRRVRASRAADLSNPGRPLYAGRVRPAFRSRPGSDEIDSETIHDNRSKLPQPLH